MKEYPWGKGTPSFVYDGSLNDSDKSFATPAGKYRLIKAIYASFVSTATVGNRILTIEVTNAAGTEVYWRAQSVSIAASQTRYIHAGAVPMAVVSAFGGNNSVYYEMSVPELILSPGEILRVYDSGTIDVAADDMIVAINLVEYDA